MDPFITGMMVFTLIVLAMVGGFVLLFPVTRRLGDVLEAWLERQSSAGLTGGELHSVLEELRSVRTQLDELASRQVSVERLLEAGKPDDPPNPPPSN